jgi:O-antigen/teichoic acid export membrane protein
MNMAFARILRNAASVLASDVVNRATTFLLYAFVARYLGTHQFGQMSLALTLSYTFQIFSVAGVKGLVTRSVARERHKAGVFLVNGGAAVLCSTCVSLLVLWVFIRWMNYSDPSTASAILWLSLGLFPYSLSAVCEAIFLGLERMHYIVYANAPANIAKVGLALMLLSRGHGLQTMILVLLASQCAIFGVELWLLLRNVAGIGQAPDLRSSWSLLKASSVFLGMDGAIAITGSANVILLSKMAGESQAGLYNAAHQLMAPVMLCYTNAVLSVYPIMCRRFGESVSALQQIAERLIEVLVAIAVPTAIVLYVASDGLLVLIYRNRDFGMASEASRIIAWNVVPIAVTAVLGQVLLAGLRERVTLRIVLLDGLFGLTIGAILIPRLGMTGAAVATLLTRLLDVLQHYVPASRLLRSVNPGKLLWRSALAGVCMAAYIMAMGAQRSVPSLVLGGLLYTVVWLTLALWTEGGVTQLKVRYISLWSD